MNGVGKMRRIGMTFLALGLLLAMVGSVSAEEIDRIREKCEELASKVEGAWYEALGMGGKSQMDRVHRDYAYLLGTVKVQQVAGLVAKVTDPAERARQQKTLNFLKEQTIWASVAPTLDNYLDYVKNASITVGDKDLIFRRFWETLRQTPDQSERRILYLAGKELITNANVYLLNVEIDLDEYSKPLGIDNYYDFIAEAHGWDRDGMTALAKAILEGTDAEYTALMETMSQKVLGMELKRVRAFDAPYLLAQPHLDDVFPVNNLESMVSDAMGHIGFKLNDKKYLRTDFKDREGKDPQAHTFSIENDRNTRITMIPDGGVDDYRAYMRKMGEALYYYDINNKLPFEDRYLGLPIMSMVFGDFMISLMNEPAWINKNLHLKESQMADYQEAMRFMRLYELREAAGMYLFQLKIHQDTKTSMKEYTQQMEEATKIIQTGNEEAFYLLSNDRFLSGGRLMAAAIEPYMRKKIIEDAGAEWYSNKRTGKFLDVVANEGFTKRYDAWAQEWGAATIDATLLLQELKAAN
ncbi:MAG: hypothetical protein KJ970_12260 [Candidatus Eisenbacteria bacterium]|uniref:Uncharacterized protein n=1 Tax=Eiseniibacteriota bacterium TaxID=2212470 RepID=A0A948W7J1_UNCEI|nr:hypothetical protein [Candidatus Eisenbacteria bacterium]MBU1949429.1 hypothetical protein [Candidatus Eisenbacteria bacterium]MBU2691691.1 hypothetical protein [Candidatus Eisenbacteria bacterium]